MARTLVALLLNAFSLVGGHFFNRRWDRAVMVLGLLAAWAVGVYAYVSVRLSALRPGAADGGAASDGLFSGMQAFVLGTLGIWALSLVLTVLDGRTGAQWPTRWNPGARLGAIALSILVGLYFTGQTLLSAGLWLGKIDTGPDDPIEIPELPRAGFSDYVYLGRGGGNDGFEDPPAGEGYLRARFTHDGAPARGVEASLVLNGRYETGKTRSDDDGVVTVRLPSGTWTVNQLRVHDWSGQPQDDREYQIVTGTEPKLAGGEYREHFWLDREGVDVVASDAPQDAVLQFAIRPRVTILWPAGEAGGPPASASGAVVKWEPYAGAASYQVQFDAVERKHRSMRYSTVLSRVVAGAPQLALAELPVMPSEEPTEYRVQVRAFGPDGTLLSESSGHRSPSSFVLGGEQLIAARPGAVTASYDPADARQVFENEKRLDAVRVLVKEGLLEEADALLAKVAGKADPASQKSVTGYLRAKQGKCAEANRLFAEALQEPGACVPESYRDACPAGPAAVTAQAPCGKRAASG